MVVVVIFTMVTLYLVFIVVSKSDWMIVNVTDDHLDFFITFDKTAVAFGSASTLNLVVSSTFAFCSFTPAYVYDVIVVLIVNAVMIVLMVNSLEC